MNLRSILTTTFTAAVLLVTTAATNAAVTSFADIEYWVGTGDSQAAFVLDFQDGNDALTWGYKWDATTSPVVTGEDLINAIAAEDDRFDANTTVFSFGTLLDGFEYDGNEVNNDFSGATWLSWSYYNGSAYNVLDYNLTGITGRVLSDGDWDVWAFTMTDSSTYETQAFDFATFAAVPAPSVTGPGNPGTSNPVPEPAALSLLAIGAAALTLGRRRRNA